MKNTDISAPDYFHKVVDCQWACPAHTPVPEYIRLIAHGRYSDAYMINWRSNVFPGILGRTCDRPCEPACRRVRVEKEPVAICRLKRVAADYKDDIRDRLPKPAARKNGKRIALVGGGPASLTVARDLAPLGYSCVVFDSDAKAGGMIRSQIPKFRLPDSVIDEECGYILDLGVEFRAGKRIDSLKALLAEGWDAVFVGSGAPRGRDLDIPGRKEAAKNIHIGIDWLSAPFDIEQFIQEKDSTVEDANESYNHGVANTRDKMDSEGHDGDSLDEEPDGPARQRYLTIYI
jgi:NADPH-dependent glutamate synthase beta subunit-like oxidoreductase